MDSCFFKSNFLNAGIVARECYVILSENGHPESNPILEEAKRLLKHGVEIRDSKGASTAHLQSHLLTITTNVFTTLEYVVLQSQLIEAFST